MGAQIRRPAGDQLEKFALFAAIKRAGGFLITRGVAEHGGHEAVRRFPGAPRLTAAIGVAGGVDQPSSVGWVRSGATS